MKIAEMLKRGDIVNVEESSAWKLSRILDFTVDRMYIKFVDLGAIEDPEVLDMKECLENIAYYLRRDNARFDKKGGEE